MKKIFKYFGIILSVALMGGLTACTIQEETTSADTGLGIKVFFPTKVVPGLPMTINGSGFTDAREIVFPQGVSVSNFEIVSNDMIRVTAPSGISADGGTILVRTTDEEVESRLPLTLGNTVVTGFSKQEGEEITGGEQITVYGSDLEFINSVELLDPDGNPLIVEDKDFYRKGTSTVIITLPKKIFEGSYVCKLHTYDAREFALPELSYKPAADEGHWETVENVVWTNPDPDGNGSISWNGTYRFAPESNSTGEEIYTIPQDLWDKMKSEKFYLNARIDNEGWYNLRITTGWWSTTYTGADIGKGDERIILNEDGTFTLEMDLTGDPILDVIDAQHLLFTGEGYTPLKIYFTEDVWVGGEGHLEVVKTSVWKNPDPDGNGSISWNGTYRFAPESNSTGEEIYTIPQDLWDKMKSEKFYLNARIDNDGWYNLRITTGWWSTTWTGADIGKGDERIILNEDGTFTLEMDLTGDPILDVLDAQHLLFTGEGYTPLEIYFQEEVWVGGGGAQEVDIWKNSDPSGNGTISWNGTYRFAPESNSTGEEIYTIPQDQWDRMKSGKFFLNAQIDNEGWYNLRITTGWWSTTYTGADIGKGDERIILNEDGTFTLELDFTGDPILDVLDAQHLLFTGEGYTPMRLYYVE